MKDSSRTQIPFIPVHEQIHRQAEFHPDKTAVICSDQRISYRELDEQSDIIAKELIKNTRRNELVAVLFEREATAYVAEIAVLKAGLGFLPFIPEYPDDRIDYCMKDSGSRLLLTTRKLKQTRHFTETEYKVVTVEDLLYGAGFSGQTISYPVPGESLDQTIILPQVSEEDLAYCIYTSGTTGRPKGVLIEHRNIANYVNKNEKSIDVMHLSSPGRVSLALASFSFDFSLEEELVPLCNGNTVVIATNEQIHNPAEFADMVIRTGADAIACTPTYLLSLLSVHESREALKKIKLFHIGAEAFPKRLYSMLREIREDSVIMNVYGPTECTIISSVSIVTGDDVITVGKPRANVQFHVLDPFGNELPVGQKGELIICGSQVGRGYVGQDDATGAFFTYGGEPAYHTGDLAAWTNDEEIVLYGRIDNQIKFHGFRIEPNEVEEVMTEIPEIQSAAVALKKKADLEYLVGYYTAKETVDRILLKRQLRRKLPSYMIPNVFLKIEKMPVSTNGKIDRSSLPTPEGNEIKTQYIPPHSEEEKKLCQAMEKVLHLPEHSIGLMDDFFDLSGDSISCMELISGVEIEGLTYTDVFTFRTPAEILSELGRKEAGQQAADLRLLEEEARTVPHMPTAVQRELIDVQLMVPHGATVSSIRFLMRLGEMTDEDRFCEALNKVLATHPGFAIRFFFDDENELRQQYDPALIPKVRIQEISPEEEDALFMTLIKPFDRLLGRSLCKAKLFHGNRGLYFFMDVHHLMADGFSVYPFFRDIVDAYQGKELKKDYYLGLLAMEEKRMLAGHYAADKEYQLHRYGGYDWCIMPFVPDPACGENGAEFCDHLRFNESQLQIAAARLSVTFSIMHIASILLAMYQITGKKDVMAFWTFHNRQTKEAEDAVGMFIKTLPVGCHMNDIQTVGELLCSVKEQVISGIAHNAYSYLVEQVFSHGIPWIESNLQIKMNASGLEYFTPEHIDLQNAYADTANNVMLAIISDSKHSDDEFDCSFSRVGEGIRAADVEQMHRKIIENLEAIVLDETNPRI